MIGRKSMQGYGLDVEHVPGFSQEYLYDRLGSRPVCTIGRVAKTRLRIRNTPEGSFLCEDKPVPRRWVAEVFREGYGLVPVGEFDRMSQAEGCLIYHMRKMLANP